MHYSTTFDLSIAVLIPTILGYCSLSAFLGRQTIPFLLQVALGYGLGTGFLTLWMLTLSALRIPFSLLSIAIPLLIAAIFFIWPSKNIKSTLSLSVIPRTPLSPISKALSLILICYIALTLFLIFWNALTIPIFEWDAVATVAFKAKIIYFEKTLAALPNFPHSAYPLHVSLLESWIALAIGNWHPTAVKIIFPCYLVSYLLIQYYFIRKITHKLLPALISIALLVSANFFSLHAWLSYSDMTLAYYICTTTLLLIFWQREKNKLILLMAGLFAGFATFTKMEGAIYLSAFIIIVIFIYLKDKAYPSVINKLKESLLFLIPSIGIFIFYFLYKIFNHVALLKEDTAIGFDITYFSRIPVILASYGKNLFLSGNWNVLWAALAVSLFEYPKKKNDSAIAVLSISIVLIFLVQFSILWLTPFYVWVAEPEKKFALLSRFILHFFPLMPSLIVLLNTEYSQPDK